MRSTLRNMLLSLTVTAAAMGAVLACMHVLTDAPVRQAALQSRIQALRGVLPPFDNDPLADSWQVTLPGDNRPVTVYPATMGGDTCGFAVESWTDAGFSGEITVMTGFDASGALSGYKVLASAETPGLGAKADDWFRDPAGSRSVLGSTAPLAVNKDPGGTVDGITAATITSRAFLDAVNRARRACESSFCR